MSALDWLAEVAAPVVVSCALYTLAFWLLMRRR